ncbi:MAG: hypothetical protein QOI38_1100 [Sphingomonadales bacterium]|nr:hypothetical protein [Sphingomonadales bacterium]
MLNFRPGAGPVVATDTKNAVAAVDDALLNSARLFASIIEATQGSNLPVGESQKLLTAMTSGLQAVLDGRGSMVSAIRQMTDIKGRSNFAPLDFGCPVGWDEMASAESRPISEATANAVPVGA